MARARRLGVPAPTLFMVELPAATLYMERVDGHSLKALLSGGALGLPDVGEDAAVTAAAEEARDVAVAAAGGGAASAMAALRQQAGNLGAGAGAAAAAGVAAAAPPPLVPAPQHPAAAVAAATTTATAAATTTTTTGAAAAATTTTTATTTAAAAAATSAAERATLALMRELGRVVARLHDGGLVHGDLTTSNVLVRGTGAWLDDRGRAKLSREEGPGGEVGLAALEEALAERAGEKAPAAAAATTAAAGLAPVPPAPPFARPPPVVLIDFGLASNSTLPEDKAVDLYVLERALGSAHPRASRRLFAAVLEGYRGASAQWSATWNRFADVRQRGRKRTMVG